MDKFAELIRLALYGAGRTRLKVGGVEFWFARGGLVYSHPMSAWNQDEVTRELIELARAGLQRASKAVGSPGIHHIRHRVRGGRYVPAPSHPRGPL